MIKPVEKFIAEAKEVCNCLDIDSAKALFDQHETAVIIDVREPRESEKSKLQDSINIPRGMLEMKVIDVCPDESQLILVHCGGGGRASLSAQRLQEMGYNNVHVIDAKYDDIKSIFG